MSTDRHDDADRAATSEEIRRFLLASVSRGEMTTQKAEAEAEALSVVECFGTI